MRDDVVFAMLFFLCFRRAKRKRAVKMKKVRERVVLNYARASCKNVEDEVEGKKIKTLRYSSTSMPFRLLCFVSFSFRRKQQASA